MGFIQFICILILKFKTRPNTSLCEIEQRERKPACSGPGVRLGKTLYKAEAGKITKYQQNSYEHLKCSRKKILISMFMSASNDNGHIYVEIKLRRHRQRGHPLPTQNEFAVNFYFCLNIFFRGPMTPLFETCLNTPSKHILLCRNAFKMFSRYK